MKEHIKIWVDELLVHWGVDPSVVDKSDQFYILGAIILVAFLVDLICRFIIIRIIKRVVSHTRTKWDDMFFNKKVLRRFSNLVPIFFVYVLIPIAFPEESETLVLLRKLCVIYIVAVILLFANTFLEVLFEMFSQKKAFRDRPLKGFLQVCQVILALIGVITVISILVNKSPAVLFTGLGASAAILMLVFKDSIMGFVSGIQLSANNMLRPGDWINVPNYGANGIVIEVTLNTVKVQNFDNTITMVPPYALTSDSFQNWRGMEESAGRRIKRAINIDMNCVKFCTPEMIEQYKQIDLLKDYIEQKEAELNQKNGELDPTDTLPANLLRQTNIGVFRAYIERYLTNLSVVNHNMTCMVRHLEPTQYGIPMEIYCFSIVKEWVAYEGIQADIFDHILGIAPIFEIRIFQMPSGADIQTLSSLKES